MFRSLLSRSSKYSQALHIEQFHNINKNFPNVYYIFARNSQLNQKKSDKDTVSSSTIVVQDGLNFRELPLAIKQTKSLSLSSDEAEKNVPEEVSANFNEMKEKLESCNDLDEVFRFLENVPRAEIPPCVSSFALNHIAGLDNNLGCRNMGLNEKNNIDSASRKSILLKLCEIVCESRDINTVLKGLGSSVRIDHGFEEKNFICDKFIAECLLRICDGKAQIENIIEFASLVSTRLDSRVLDQLWSPISDKFQEIDISNLAKMYNILPLLKSSRRTVFKIVEKRTFTLWWQLTVSDVENILSVLVKINFQSQNLLLSLSKWIHLNIHSLSETELEKIVGHFEKLDYIHSNLETALQRYIKVRNLQIKNPSLVAAIMSYCQHFKLQSNIILDSVARYFVANAFEIPPNHIVTIVKPFGVLNYVPNMELKFYKVLEDVIIAKFVDFRPEDLIELLLTCTYVKRYPLNFVRKIFNPYFLERLNTIEDKLELEKARTNLRLLDMAMTLECGRYRGPLLPRERPVQVVNRNARLLKIIDKMSLAMNELFGGYKYFLSNKWLHQYPFSETYIADFIIHFDRDGNIMPIEEIAKVDKRKIIVILMPEHYCHGKQCISGPQAAKMRLFEKLGYEVIRLDYEDINILYGKPTDLSMYIKEKLF
uniref:RAP domain-containing protein n=1 Tax=Strigamia maritima TaxID=126957 RepID=T1JKK1_STRMM